jgi:hypothetical protein
MNSMKISAAAAFAGLALTVLVSAPGLAAAQEKFASPEKAFDALIEAAKSGNKGAVRKVLGPGAGDIISSGDSVADKNARRLFITAYDNGHNIDTKGDTATLSIGKDQWPFPIPVEKKGESWVFDTKQGRDEILRRRIGRDELSAIRVTRAYVVAQNEYEQAGIGGPNVYARKIVSTPGQKDGLFWPTADGEKPSPLGPLAAEAAAEGYKAHRHPIPYHGYFYRVLTQQGDHADGGAKNYIVDGKMTGGFALIAYPARYGSSGIMTFIVNQQGVIYQKDLGADTTKHAHEIQAFSPGSGWTKVTDGQ